MKNKRANIVIVTIVFLSICVGVIFHMKKDANTIFYEAVDGIVELKAESEVQNNYGSAVFIDSNLLVTNAHVVIYKNDGNMVPYDSFFIRFADEEHYREVFLVQYDEVLDIAVLKFEDKEKNIRGVRIGNSDGLDFGNQIYAIGNSMNGGLSIAEGIIGIPEVFIEYEGITRRMIQADVTIASGNSGGALLNDKGELVGITSCRVKDLNGNVVYGIAYSIPINQVMNYIDFSSNPNWKESH